SARSATGQSPTTGWRQSPDLAQASGSPLAFRAACRRSTRSRGTNGQSPGTLTSHSIAGAWRASQSSPARMPASGPAKPWTSSAMTGRQNRAKRAGSPLALSTMPAHWERRRAKARSRMVSSPMRISALSPPPMRRASPPASTSPKVDGTSVVMRGCLAPMPGGFILDVTQVLVEHDARLAGERDEAFAARAPDQCEAGLAGELHPPRGEAGARDEDRDAHAHRLDHHLGGQPPGRIENL